MTADTWAIVAATGLGPILAVGLTLGFTYWRETAGAKYNRRLHVFRTLMLSEGKKHVPIWLQDVTQPAPDEKTR